MLPAIATVCRQTLHETTGIFLRETEFELVIQDHDGAFEVSAYQRVRAFHALLINKFGFRKEYFSPWDPALTFSGQPHWMNLLQWCKTIHASKENLGIATCDDDDHPHTAVSADIEIASLVVNAANEGKKEEWETVEKRLEIMHRIAALKDPRWK